MRSIVGRQLPDSKEATIKVRHPNWQHVMAGTVMEANMLFFDGYLAEIRYKHSWVKRMWYTSRIGRQFWTRTE